MTQKPTSEIGNVAEELRAGLVKAAGNKMAHGALTLFANTKKVLESLGLGGPTDAIYISSRGMHEFMDLMATILSPVDHEEEKKTVAIAEKILTEGDTNAPSKEEEDHIEKLMDATLTPDALLYAALLAYAGHSRVMKAVGQGGDNMFKRADTMFFAITGRVFESFFEKDGGCPCDFCKASRADREKLRKSAGHA